VKSSERQFISFKVFWAGKREYCYDNNRCKLCTWNTDVSLLTSVAITVVASVLWHQRPISKAAISPRKVSLRSQGKWTTVHIRCRPKDTLEQLGNQPRNQKPNGETSFLSGVTTSVSQTLNMATGNQTYSFQICTRFLLPTQNSRHCLAGRSILPTI